MLNIVGKGGMAREVQCYEGYPCIMAEHEEIKDLSLVIDTVIAIGDGHVRKKLALAYPELNYCNKIYGVVHQPWIDGKRWFSGQGLIICPGSRLTTNIRVGKHVIINNNATVAHDCILGDYTTVSPGANISGNVTIGNLCYIGTGACIREKITICDGVFIGAGSVVVKDIIESGVYVGNPCRKIKAKEVL